MPNTPQITPFADRLKKYGLTDKDVHADVLRVGNKRTVYLGSQGAASSFSPKFISAGGIDDVKKWLGVPNPVLKKDAKLAENRKLKKAPSTTILSSFDKIHQDYLKEKRPDKKKSFSDNIGALLSDKLEDIGSLAKAYIYGESDLYTAWRPLLDWHFQDFKLPVWLFNTVIVENGSVLEINEGVHKLVGNKLVIERGGTIIARNYLNLEFTTITRTV